jgi:hypothetical protein
MVSDTVKLNEVIENNEDSNKILIHNSKSDIKTDDGLIEIESNVAHNDTSMVDNVVIDPEHFEGENVNSSTDQCNDSSNPTNNSSTPSSETDPTTQMESNNNSNLVNDSSGITDEQKSNENFDMKTEEKLMNDLPNNISNLENYSGSCSSQLEAQSTADIVL